MRSIVDSNGQELVRILKMQEYAVRKSQFFLNPKCSLQVGSLNFPAGGKVEPHIHKAKNVGVAFPVEELILMLAGKAVLEVYDDNKNMVETVKVSTGDMLLLMRGGHGYRFTENTQLLDIRCGPYTDKAHDKEMI